MVIAVWAALVGAAHADNKAKARAAFHEATKHYDLGEYDRALEAFKEAYRNVDDPAFLFNIAQCYRQLGDNANAIHFYQAYLRQQPHALNAAAVRDVIATLEKALAQAQAAKSMAPPGTAAPTESPPVESTPPATSAPTTAVQPATVATVAAAPSPRQPVYKKWWLWTSLVVVALVAAGVAVAVVATQPMTPTANTDFGTFRF